MRIALAAALAVACLYSHSAAADPRYRDRVYADSFGNLVIHSPGGYKRIVVDKGYLAEELAAFGSRVDGPVEPVSPTYAHRATCRLPAVEKGRGFMYGLPEGVVPIISRRCE